MSLALTELYGGALTVCLPTARTDKPDVPLKFLDMSNFRQVPDHQEVHSDLDTGCVVIIELLGTTFPEVPNDAEACGLYYFKDLAQCNECEMGTTAILTSTNTISDEEAPNFPTSGVIPNSPNVSTLLKCIAEGTQLISKFVNEQDKLNEVYVGMAIIRLSEPAATDLVVSVSVPVKIHPESSEAKNVTPETVMSVDEAQRVLKTVVGTLKMERWSLFV